MQTYPTLYKKDSEGRVRIWRMERDGAQHRCVSGLKDGAHTTTGWTTCVPRSKPTAEEQAEFEVEALYRYNLERDYHDTEDTLDQPKYFAPMLAQAYEAFAPGYAQPKLDGFRCIAKRDGLWTREGKPIPAAAHISAALAALFREHPDAILDGELYHHDLRDDFEKLSSILKKQDPTPEQLKTCEEAIQLHVYDHPSHNGGFLHRFQIVSNLVTTFCAVDGPIKLVRTEPVEDEATFDDLFAHWNRDGYEGAMLRLNGPYQGGKRSRYLLKRKTFIDSEFEVVRIEAGKGNWAGVAKKVFIRLPNGLEQGAGIAGTKERAAELLHETHKVVTVQYTRLTKYGKLKNPVATKFHGEGREL